MALQKVEVWDDDDLQGDILNSSAPTRKTSMSSRLSFRSESNAGDDDWQVPLTVPQDNQAVSKAISSAEQAGIPIPDNVPTSALTGGMIKRLGSKKSQTKVNNDWGDDLELPQSVGAPLQLKPRSQSQNVPSGDLDDLDDWGEGSLGIRDAGTGRGSNTRDSNASGMSPSMKSVKTAETEDDGMEGLVLPSGHMNFGEALQKRQGLNDGRENVQVQPQKELSTPVEQPSNNHSEDFFADIEFGAGEVFDTRKRGLNRNIKQSWKPSKESSPATRTQTTVTFTDRAASTRIPRPVNGLVRPGRLEPVLESGQTVLGPRHHRQEPTTTSAQLLRSKRSMPALRSQPSMSRLPPQPFLSSNTSISQSHHIRSNTSHHNLRQEADAARIQSPQPRPMSRSSHMIPPDTPTRQRADVATHSLAREAATKRTVTRPAKRRNFGDGTELDLFDDLPTSAAKESKYVKQPSAKAPSTQRMIRAQPSQSRLGLRDRMVTPSPQTPRSPTKSDSLPRFARDTASSRIARESKIGPTPIAQAKPRGETPLMSRTNWPAQVAARSPHTSPTAQRAGRKGPTLINPMGKENARQFQDEAAKKGMQWNPILCRWEGNESAMLSFDPSPAPPSPPRRPAVITNVTGAQQTVQVVGGMVFDPQKMCWLKLGATPSDPRSPSLDDDDPFKDIEDLKEAKHEHEEAAAPGSHALSAGSDWLVGEEFDLGPEFIRRQREEEVVWRSRVGAWFGDDREKEGNGYVWAIKDLAATVAL